MDVRATRLKYREAAFFLARMEETCYEDVHRILAQSSQPISFPFYLSAFLSAARSITWVMRQEFSDVEGWEEWYKAQGSAEHAQMLGLFNKLRNQSEKIEPVIPGRTFRLVGDGGPPVKRDPQLPRFSLAISAGEEDTGSAPLMSGEVMEWVWTIDDLDGADLLEACKQYLALLAELVDRCEQRFRCASVSK
jgi:hypothetical protein